MVVIGTTITVSQVYAARMYIESPKTASSNREPLVVMILVDVEKDVVSGVSGNFSFPSELFDVKTISTQNGIVPLWAVQPHISSDKFFDQRTHITFEGIIPGGFSGVRNPYIQNVFPGILFTVVLIPKNIGQDTFILEDIELHAYDSNGTTLPSKKDTKVISIPHITGKRVVPSSELKFTDNTTVTMEINRSELVNDNSPYLYIHENDASRTIDHIEVAESPEYNPTYVSSYEWHTVSNPYVLLYASRTKYVHAKIVYTNNTYTFKTLPPVENSETLLDSSRILVYILVAISLLYFYGKNFLHLISKSRTKSS